MLHAEPPDLLAAVETRDDRFPSAARREEPSGRLRIADGGGEPDSPRVASGQPAQAFDQAERLQPAVGAQKRMDLVDHDEPQVAEQRRDLRVLVDHHGFQRFRGDLQDARRLAQEFPFPRLRHIAVPAVHVDAFLLAQLVQTSELVVDQGLQRRDIQHTDALRRLLVQQRQDREESGLGLPRRGRGGEQHVRIRVENGVARRVLHAAQALPAGTVDIILNEWRVPVEYVHKENSMESLSVWSGTASDFA